MRSSVPAPILGGCLCSEVRYCIEGGPLARSLCHCRPCRLAAGAAGVAWLVVRREDFALTREIWLEQRLARELPDERLMHFQRSSSE